MESVQDHDTSGSHIWAVGIRASPWDHWDGLWWTSGPVLQWTCTHIPWPHLLLSPDEVYLWSTSRMDHFAMTSCLLIRNLYDIFFARALCPNLVCELSNFTSTLVGSQVTLKSKVCIQIQSILMLQDFRLGRLELSVGNRNFEDSYCWPRAWDQCSLSHQCIIQ